MTIAQMLDCMSAQELQAWRLYYAFEPFGFERADYHAALVASTVANCAGKSIKGHVGVEKFMHNGGNVDEQDLTEEQQFAMLDRLLGGKNVQKLPADKRGE